MPFETRDNSGAIFKNEKRLTDTHPNATGKCMVGGEMYYISAWTKTDKNGNKWQSLAFKAVETQTKKAPEDSKKNSDPGDFSDFDDDIPF